MAPSVTVSAGAALEAAEAEAELMVLMGAAASLIVQSAFSVSLGGLAALSRRVVGVGHAAAASHPCAACPSSGSSFSSPACLQLPLVCSFRVREFALKPE